MRSGTSAPSIGKATAALLPRNLEKHLLAYTAAAGAGLLSVAMPAEAEIVYTQSNTPITVNHGSINLDLNNDGIVDFTLHNFFTNNSRGGTYSVFLGIVPAQAANQIFSFVSNGKVTAAALPDGVQVGPKGRFQSNSKGLNLFGYNNRAGGSYGGDWGKVEYAYIGLKFMIGSEVHFGWARVKYDAPGDHNLPSIYGYAYETVANQPIVTGKTLGGATDKRPLRSDAAKNPRTAPVSLGLLAAGAPGIDVWRKKIPTQE
jgi:hypothetical protein